MLRSNKTLLSHLTRVTVYDYTHAKEGVREWLIGTDVSLLPSLPLVLWYKFARVRYVNFVRFDCKKTNANLTCKKRGHPPYVPIYLTVTN
jgi:hypothetical protein